MEYKVEHLKDKSTFVTVVDGYEAIIEYHPYKGGIDIYHTFVPKEIGGRGVAAVLAKSALEYALSNNLTVRPTCSYIKSYIERYKTLYEALVEQESSPFGTIEGMSGNACGIPPKKEE